MFKFPESAKALVDDLDRMFPERIPEAGDDMIAIHRYAAKRELILLLKFARDHKAKA